MSETFSTNVQIAAHFPFSEFTANTFPTSTKVDSIRLQVYNLINNVMQDIASDDYGGLGTYEVNKVLVIIDNMFARRSNRPTREIIITEEDIMMHLNPNHDKATTGGGFYTHTP